MAEEATSNLAKPSVRYFLFYVSVPYSAFERLVQAVSAIPNYECHPNVRRGVSGNIRPVTVKNKFPSWAWFASGAKCVVGEVKRSANGRPAFWTLGNISFFLGDSLRFLSPTIYNASAHAVENIMLSLKKIREIYNIKDWLSKMWRRLNEVQACCDAVVVPMEPPKQHLRTRHPQGVAMGGVFRVFVTFEFQQGIQNIRVL